LLDYCRGEFEILKHKGGEWMKKMKKRIESKVIREIMTPSPVTVRPDTSISDLKALFERYDFNAFPVVDELGVLRGSPPSWVYCGSSVPTGVAAGSPVCWRSGPNASTTS
jgi:CBS domain-containing protein